MPAMLLSTARTGISHLPVDLLLPFLAPCTLRPFSSAAPLRSAAPTSQFTYKTSVAFHGKPAYPAPAGEKVIRTLPANSPVRKWVEAGNLAMGRFAEGGVAKVSGGDDWYFVAEPTENRKELVVGLADGVGGWSESFIDPSIFSQALMYHSRETVAAGEGVDPKEVLQAGYDKLQKDSDVEAGSSTALVMSFAEDGIAKAANLGDSSFHLLRQESPSEAYKVIHSQSPMTHFFNAPRQLAKYPRGANVKKALIDLPSIADEWSTQLQDGDLIVATTDGFSDNVFTFETEQLVALLLSHEPSKGPLSFLDRLSVTLLNYARMCSVKVDKVSPFELEAREHGHHDLKGGKVDDVLVIVVKVERTQ